MARMLRSIKSLIQTEGEFGAGARDWAAGDQGGAPARLGAGQPGAAPTSPGSSAEPFAAPIPNLPMSLADVRAPVLAVAAAAQRVAYDNEAGSAADALNALLDLPASTWFSPNSLGAGDEIGPNIPYTPPGGLEPPDPLFWQFSNGYFTSGGAAAFAAQSGGTLVVAFRGTDGGDPELLEAVGNVDLQVRELHRFIERVITYVRDASNGVTELVLTGHSLGGELAEIFASIYLPRILAAGSPLDASNCYLLTFGSLGVPPSVIAIDVNGDDQISTSTLGIPEFAHTPLPVEILPRTISFGHGEDPVFQHTGLAGAGLSWVDVFNGLDFVRGSTAAGNDVIAAVADSGSPAYIFDGRNNESLNSATFDASEHHQNLYYQVWTDLAHAAWFNVWKLVSFPIFALNSTAVDSNGLSLFNAPPSDAFALPVSQINSTILGLFGSDTILAGNGVDFIFGGNGDDIIFGGASVDYLDWGPSDDTLTGGTGGDLY